MSYVQKMYDITPSGQKDKKDKKHQADTPSFFHALEKHPKQPTKYFGESSSDSDDGDKDKKDKKKKKKKGGSAAYGNKAANLGAYVV